MIQDNTESVSNYWNNYYNIANYCDCISKYILVNGNLSDRNGIISAYESQVKTLIMSLYAQIG